jgi:hypothetical protein
MDALQKDDGEEFISPHDLISIYAMVEHLAHTKKIQRENAYYLLETELKVKNVKHIKRSDVDRAKAFLVDLRDVTVH